MPWFKLQPGPYFEGVAEINALVSNDYGSMERTVKVNVGRSQDF